jgi:hypothetical protein
MLCILARLGHVLLFALAENSPIVTRAYIQCMAKMQRTRAVGARLTQISGLRSVPSLSAVARVRLARLDACLEDPQLGT